MYQCRQITSVDLPHHSLAYARSLGVDSRLVPNFLDRPQELLVHREAHMLHASHLQICVIQTCNNDSKLKKQSHKM